MGPYEASVKVQTHKSLFGDLYQILPKIRQNLRI
jgi:hypothetical protein